MACVTKHHRKEEGERDDGIGCWGGGGGGGREEEGEEGVEM